MVEETTAEITTEIQPEEKLESETTEATFSFDAPVSTVEEVSAPAETSEAMEMTLNLGETSTVSEASKEEKPEVESSKEEKKETTTEASSESAPATTDDAVDSSKKKKHKKKEVSSDKAAAEEVVVEEKAEKVSVEKKKKKKKSEKDAVDVTLAGATSQKVEEEANVVIELAAEKKLEETSEEVETVLVLAEAKTEKTEGGEGKEEKSEGKEEAEALVFDVPLADLTVKAGEEAKLFVKVTSQPEPWVKWFRDGTEIKSSGESDLLTRVRQQKPVILHSLMLSTFCLIIFFNDFS